MAGIDDACCAGSQQRRHPSSRTPGWTCCPRACRRPRSRRRPRASRSCAAASGAALPLPARLDAVRNRLKAAGVDGFILQRTDEFASEYLPPSAERMAWLTGFTGSAGVTVVLAAKAAVFVDGRYTVQVREQVDAARFEIAHLIDHPPARWIEENLPDGAALGYDPMLTKAGERERLAKVVATRSGRLVALLPENPVDAVWDSRPARPDRRPAHGSTTGSPARPVRPSGPAWAQARRKAGRVAGADRPRLRSPGCSTSAAATSRTTRWPELRPAACRGRPCRLFVDPRKIPRGLVLDNAVSVEPQEAFVAALERARRGRRSGAGRPSATHVGLHRPPARGRCRGGRGGGPLRPRQGSEERGRDRRCRRRPAPRWCRHGPLPRLARCAAA